MNLSGFKVQSKDGKTIYTKSIEEDFHKFDIEVFIDSLVTSNYDFFSNNTISRIIFLELLFKLDFITTSNISKQKLLLQKSQNESIKNKSERFLKFLLLTHELSKDLFIYYIKELIINYIEKANGLDVIKANIKIIIENFKK
jgi:hypothetical protein